MTVCSFFFLFSISNFFFFSCPALHVLLFLVFCSPSEIPHLLQCFFFKFYFPKYINFCTLNILFLVFHTFCIHFLLFYFRFLFVRASWCLRLRTYFPLLFIFFTSPDCQVTPVEGGVSNLIMVLFFYLFGSICSSGPLHSLPILSSFSRTFFNTFPKYFLCLCFIQRLISSTVYLSSDPPFLFFF